MAADAVGLTSEDSKRELLPSSTFMPLLCMLLYLMQMHSQHALSAATVNIFFHIQTKEICLFTSLPIPFRLLTTF